MKKLFLLYILISSVLLSQPSKNEHTDYDKLLKKYVDKNGFVNYKAFASNQKFKDYISFLSNADENKYSTNEKLAFYINAYNAFVIQNVLDNYPITSPLKVDGFFKKIKFKIAGEEMTLDELEHKKIFPIEPIYTHFGLVCAAKSCPKLIQTAYTSENVYKLLKENGQIFLKDNFKNEIDYTTGEFKVSQIFNWFKKSFVEKHGSVEIFLKEFLKINKEQKLNITYKEYNWELNEQ